jgi:putative membrane protein
MQIIKWRNERDEHNVWKGLAAGLIGGLVASWTMNRFQSLLGKLSSSEEGSQGKSEEKEPATVKAAEAISEGVFDHELTKEEKRVAGPAVHYAFGSLNGAVYGAMAEVVPETTVGAGLPFGALLWLGADEIAVPLVGLSKSPLEHPLSTHAYALASHLVYGLTTDVVRRAVRNMM